VFYNRMSASSHTRDHRFSPELASGILAWLVRWGRRVVNGPGALDLEISKVRQYAALERHGIPTPRTVLVAGRDRVAAAARQHFPDQPVILKPNRGGKGLGVQLFLSADSLDAYLAGAAYEAPVDGMHLLQEYIRAPRPVITRAEFVGGRFLYAVEVDTSEGFELCPADACAVGDANCPVGEAPRDKFTIMDGIPSSLRVVKVVEPPWKVNRPVHRTEKLSVATPLPGPPFPQSLLIVGSQRVKTGAPDSVRLLKYSARY